MKSKKVVLFIVEGISDQTSLALVLSKLFKDQSVSFQVVNKDITSYKFTTVANVVSEVNAQIKMFMDKNFLTHTHMLKVIHLIDTDGAYVGEDYIKQEDIEGYKYSPDFIRSRNVETVQKRNGKKSNILNKLSSCSQIAKIPYSMYYFSCNLEHILHDECNLEEYRKMEAAEKFRDEFYGREEEFLKFIKDEEFAVQGDFKETWDFIKVNNNSLKRYCNFHLFFQG